jgi:hypothetical protein
MPWGSIVVVVVIILSLGLHVPKLKMAFGVTVAQLNAFASQAFIRKAIKNPFCVSSVLSFFFVR